ncbi:Histidine kinase-like ATPase domain-containing protein [Streptomyces sp. 2224.1]|uniref:ATP-binding protein n=1 Tax=Streptomyces sp. 2224.1 TaxID=1881020 RepID=UPI000898EF70|nr:ATP-binding protein [Streptomyces sp. 2224.1]SEC27936.1 Histidine kinase-like ATPase domain-containing protein [Streptomyces sp. 2224.1]
MNVDHTSLRRLPWTGEDGRPCYLSTDGTGPVSRLVNRLEGMAPGAAGGPLGQAQDVFADFGRDPEPELGSPESQLTDALWGALRESPTPLQALGLQSLPGGDLSSACAARHYVRTMACWWGVVPEQTEALELITGELVGNALKYSNSRLIAVVLSRTARAACIGVTDEGQGCAFAPARPGPEQEGGRGLLIVEALADRWGRRKLGGGFTIWAEMVLKC